MVSSLREYHPFESAKTHVYEHLPDAAFMGDFGTLRGYLNGEFNQILVELASTRMWCFIKLDAGFQSIRNALSTTWTDVEIQLKKKHVFRRNVLLLAIKFHWDYESIAKLGPRLDHQMPETKM